MNPSLSERYAAILGHEHIRDELFPASPRRMPELELQARWFAGEFGTRFRSPQGDEIEIIQPGIWNHEPGPDFSGAAIAINGGEPLRGSIELDWDVRDWEQHGHSSNPAFADVVLHVFVTRGPAEFFSRDLAHRNVPQVQLDPGECRAGEVSNGADVRAGRCAAVLNREPQSRTESVLNAAAEYRLKRKAGRFRRLVRAHGEDEALYQQIAEAFGYKSNRVPFMLVSQRLPLRRLLRAKEDIEPLLFGLSGFLSMRETPRLDGEGRAFLRVMWEKWWRLRGEFERLLLPESEWRLGGQRPQNHPQRRLAALAQTVRQWPALKRQVERHDVEGIARFFAELSDPYWDFHFTLTSAPSARKIALVGETRIHELLVNVFYPWLIEERPELWDDYLALRSRLENRRATIAGIRLFPSETIREQYMRKAAYQQALLQIYEDFCLRDCSNCGQCPFPVRVEEWSA